MFSPMFDGQYRSKPQVSLRGASRKEERVKLLERVHEEREQRENSRRRLLAATTIQAYYRGHVERQQLYTNLREEFDRLISICSSSEGALSLCRLMSVFYQKKKDHGRLVKLCQKWIQYHRELVQATPINQLCAHHLRLLLTHCCSSLYSDPSQSIATPLRMIEVFLDSQSYPSSRRQQVIHYLYSYLIPRDYFRCLRKLLETRVPAPAGVDDRTHSPLGSSLLEYIARPFSHGVEEEGLYVTLARDVFNSPLSPHVCYLILPHLMTIDLNLNNLLEALLEGVAIGGVASSLELLYILLRLVHNHIRSKFISQKSLAQYLQLVALLLSTINTGHVRSHDDYYDDDDDDDNMESMDEGDLDPLASREELYASCMATITGSEVPTRLRLESSISTDLVASLCSYCYQVISHSKSNSFTKTKLLQLLALNPDLLPPMWNSITELTTIRSFGEPVSCLHHLSKGLSLPPQLGAAIIERLSTFSSLFTLYLSTLHDAELYCELEGNHTPFTTKEIVDMVAVLRDCFINLQLEKHLPSSMFLGHRAKTTRPSVQEWIHLKQCIHGMICALYERDCRRPFCPPDHWAVLPSMQNIPPELFLENDGDEEGGVVNAAPSVLKQADLLKSAPFVFPFIERVKFFSSLVIQDRSASQGRHQEFLMGPSINLSVRRNHVYEDAFAELAQGQDLRKKLRVMFVNAQGLDELGIDGGGLFREFLTEVLKTGFDPNRGYFSTTQDGLLYPNPQAPVFNEDFAMHYQFLGSMLGKALYEGLLVELPFAGFFLCKLADSGRGTIGAHHLASFDSELYRQLLSLKHYSGDIEDLDLNFTLVSNELGQTKVIELKRGGADIPVTKSNCVEYIHLVSHYKLNVQLDRQFQAFRRGLSSVVPLHWLRLFSQNELQVLISGARVPIDVQDLRQHTGYSGEYKEDHPVIKLFWEVVSSFSEKEKRQLLKFVTSCSRPPLLGFKELTPPFRINPGLGEERLPTASTCMNVLKLPQFQDAATLKSKLLYAIQSGAGFELS